jgi:ABC-type nitrate/sulfonate/bicarbonate transport system substrate-binding protein
VSDNRASVSALIALLVATGVSTLRRETATVKMQFVPIDGCATTLASIFRYYRKLFCQIVFRRFAGAG